MSASTSKAAAVAGSALLIAAGALAASPLSVAVAATGADAPAAQGTSENASAARTTVAPQAQGTFAFSQDAVSATADISGVFAKAAATLCVALPQYCHTCGGLITVSGPGSSFEATADQLSDEAPAGAVMACACASNVAGGGAMVNAGVSGAAIELLASLAGAL